MTLPHSDRVLLLILRLGAFLCLLGWTWSHLYWQGPYGVLVWQEETYALAERFGVSWDGFVGTGANDGIVQKGIRGIGWLYLVGSFLCLTVRRGSTIQMIGLVGASGLLILLSYAKYVSAARQLPMFVEHGGQILMPVLLVLALWKGVTHRTTIFTAMAAFIATFMGHGAYAIGWWPTPPTFMAMTSVILGTDHESTLIFLRVAGVLDFVICLGILVPRIRLASALYGLFWGFVTALARPVAGMSTDLNFWGADQFIHEAVLRAPHYMIPAYLALLWWRPAWQDSEVSVPVESRSATADGKKSFIARMFLLTNPELKDKETP